MDEKYQIYLLSFTYISPKQNKVPFAVRMKNLFLITAGEATICSPVSYSHSRVPLPASRMDTTPVFVQTSALSLHTTGELSPVLPFRRYFQRIFPSFRLMQCRCWSEVRKSKLSGVIAGTETKEASSATASTIFW